MKLLVIAFNHTNYFPIFLFVPELLLKLSVNNIQHGNKWNTNTQEINQSDFGQCNLLHFLLKLFYLRWTVHYYFFIIDCFVTVQASVNTKAEKTKH